MKGKPPLEMEHIKKLIVIALTSDDMFIGLVLKGGNALQLGYDISSRGSLDGYSFQFYMIANNYYFELVIIWLE